MAADLGGAGAQRARAPREGNPADLWLSFGGNPNLPISKAEKAVKKSDRHFASVSAYNEKLSDHYDELLRLKKLIKGAGNARVAAEVVREYRKIMAEVDHIRDEVKKAGGTPLAMANKLNKEPKYP